MKKYKPIALYSLVVFILKLTYIENIVYQLIVSDRHYKKVNEDLDAINSNVLKLKYTL